MMHWVARASRIAAAAMICLHDFRTVSAIDGNGERRLGNGVIAMSSDPNRFRLDPVATKPLHASY